MKTQDRPLTQEELNLAWALDWKPTHYNECSYGRVELFNKEKLVVIYAGVVEKIMDNVHFIDDGDFPEIPKPFDIESVEWGDGNVAGVELVMGDYIETHMDLGWSLTETKQDIINKAKALGVTAEDLK